MRKSYVIWFFLFIGIVVLSIVASAGNLLWYLDIASLIMIIAPATFLSLACFRFQEIVSFFRAAFNGGDRVVLENAVLFFDSLKRYFLSAGIIGGFCGSVVMLISEDTVIVAQGVALVIVTILYAIIAVTGIAIPFATAARKQLNELEAR